MTKKTAVIIGGLVVVALTLYGVINHEQVVDISSFAELRTHSSKLDGRLVRLTGYAYTGPSSYQPVSIPDWKIGPFAFGERRAMGQRMELWNKPPLVVKTAYDVLLPGSHKASKTLREAVAFQKSEGGRITKYLAADWGNWTSAVWQKCMVRIFIRPSEREPYGYCGRVVVTGRWHHQPYDKGYLVVDPRSHHIPKPIAAH